MNPGPHNSFDVAVIGAGPAGCTAALALARSGHTVALLEKAALPRYKTCGGGLLARAFKRLPRGVLDVVERSFHSIALHLPGAGMDFIATRQEPIVYLTMRADLDCLLAREAERSGARLIESCAVKSVSVGNDGAEISSGHTTYRAKFVIAADGVHSVAAKAAGWAELPALVPALEHELHVADEDFARFSQMPRFDFDAVDAGYAWVFPKRAHLSVGILSTRRVCPNLQSKLAEYLRKLGITRVQKAEKHGFLIPLAPRRGPLARGRMLLAGDAAGLADPVTAEGITHAILSGQFAAVALTEGGMDPAKVSNIYQSLLESNILGELRAARVLARILYHHPRIRNTAFRLNGQKLSEFVTNVVMGQASYRDTLKRPSSYLKFFGL